MNITLEPVVCQRCYDCIGEFINFRTTCQRTEQIIKERSSALSKKLPFFTCIQKPVDLSDLAREDDTSNSYPKNKSQEETKPVTRSLTPICLDHCYALKKDQEIPTAEIGSVDKNVGENNQGDLDQNCIDLENEYFGSSPDEDDKQNLTEAQQKLYKHNLGFGPYLCEYCAKIYKCLNRYKRHVRKNHIKSPLKHNNTDAALCATCGEKFHSKARHIMHQKAHGEKSIYCFRCQRKYIFKKRYKMFALSSHQWAKRKCETCNKNLYNVSLFNKHIYRHRRQAYKKALSLQRSIMQEKSLNKEEDYSDLPEAIERRSMMQEKSLNKEEDYSSLPEANERRSMMQEKSLNKEEDYSGLPEVIERGSMMQEKSLNKEDYSGLPEAIEHSSCDEKELTLQRKSIEPENEDEDCYISLTETIKTSSCKQPSRKWLKAKKSKTFGMACPYCNKYFTSQLDYITHVKWHTLLPQLACQFCKRSLFVRKIQDEKSRLCEYHCLECKKMYVVELIQIQTLKDSVGVTNKVGDGLGSNVTL